MNESASVNENPLVIYHGGCRDGWCSAWVIHRRYPEAEYVAGFYGQPPPNCTDKHVILVDFSYPRDVLEKMAEQAATLLVLDHHKTAQAALEGFERPNTQVIFDMDRSGAGLAWDHFMLDRPSRDVLVDYVEDRDLWRHRLPDSKLVNAWIATLPFTFRAWTGASMTIAQDIVETGDPLTWAKQMGAGALAKGEQYVREVVKNARLVVFQGHKVPLVNAPQVDISELLDELARQQPEVPFVMGWWQRGDGIFQYSLRSRGDFDVSDLAKTYGGGGHRQAAGFQVPTAIL